MITMAGIARGFGYARLDDDSRKAYGTHELTVTKRSSGSEKVLSHM